MMKWSARLLQLFILLVLLGFLGIVAFITLTDPNQYKDRIQKQVQNLSKRTLIIKGPLRWRISNGLAIEATDITLANRSGFDKEFLTIQKAQFTPHLWSIITGRILVDLKLFDADLSLSRKSLSFNNWQDLFETLPNKKDSVTSKIIFNTIQIKNINVEWHDDVLKRDYIFKNICLNTGSLLQVLKGDFSLATLEFDLKNSSQDKITHAELMKDPISEQTLRTILSAQWTLSNGFKNLELQNILIKAEMKDVSPILLTLNKVKIQDLNSTPILTGNISSNAIELEPWLGFFKIKSSMQMPKNLDINAEFKYASPTLEIISFNANLKPIGYFEGHLKIDSLSNFRESNMEGMVHGKGLKIGSLNIPDLKATLQMKSGVLTLNPIEYQYAGGEHHGHFQIDYSTPNTKYSFSQESNHFEITNLLETLGYHNKMEGRARFKFNFKSEGESFSHFKENLSGQGEFEIMNGKIIGIDAQKLLKHAQSTVKSLMFSVHNKKATNVAAVLKSELGQWEEQATQQNNYSTPFTHIKGSFSLDSLVITNPDLSILHPQFTIHGNGTLNLGDENLICHLFGLYKDPASDPNDEIALFLNQTPLGVDIKGPLQEPGFKPDLENYAQHALKFSQRNMFEKFVDKTFNNITDTTNDLE